MTTATTTLTDFLLARIAEDEAWAKHRDIVTFGCDDSRMNPARVLAECDAKREALRLIGTLGGHYEPNASRIARQIERTLALPYADHDDYNPEWRP